jgi:hypothetical protein
MIDDNANFFINYNFTLPKTTKLTEEVVQQLDHMLEYSTPEEYRNTLIEVYHHYLIHEHETLPIEFERMQTTCFYLSIF